MMPPLTARSTTSLGSMGLVPSLGFIAALNRNRRQLLGCHRPLHGTTITSPVPGQPSGQALHTESAACAAQPANFWEQVLEPFMGVHISGVVAAIAAVPALAAWTLRSALPLPVSVVLWHTAGTGFLVATAATEALAGHTTGILGKRADGTISPLHFTLLWPYHLGLRAKLALQRRLSSEPAFSQITPEYFIGAWPSEEKLVPTVHPAVLDVTCELPLQLVPPAYLNLAVWDTHAPTPAQIDQGVQWALQQRMAGRPVLVHCAHGHGRSATVLAAILIAEGKAKGPADAEALMKAERPRVRLNHRQRAALKQWAAIREGGKQE